MSPVIFLIALATAINVLPAFRHREKAYVLFASIVEDYLRKRRNAMSRPHNGGQQHLAPARTRGLILGCAFLAALFNGMLASGINRTLVDMPAWQRVGAPAWAEFSRWADMGPYGLVLYPLEGIGGAVLSVVAAILFSRSCRSRTRSGALPTSAAALLALGGMLATTQAAPTLLGTRHTSDPAALQQALNRFAFWGGVRAVFQSLAFVANLWSLVAVSRNEDF